MAVTLHSAGLSHARSLINAGKVNASSSWSFSADDGNALLGDPPDWAAYAKWFMGHDTAANPETKDAWKYPFGKGGVLYRSALGAIASRAAQQNETEISNAASTLIALLDKPKAYRAWSVFTVKSVDDEQRIIEGIASTPTTDRMGDIVEPTGAQYALPMPLLWQHDSRQPIGQVIAASVSEAGISIRAQIAKNLLPRIDEAWALIKSGLVRGLSIGFKPIEEADIKDTWGTRFMKWEWLELSAVTIPANAEASIHVIKSCDQERAASGVAQVVHLHQPGVSGARRVKPTRTDLPTMKKSYADQIASWEATRKAKTDRMDDILSAAADGDVTLDAAQKEEHDTLDGEVKEIDDTLIRLRGAEARSKASAVEVKGTNTREAITGRQGVITVERKLPPGILFARYAMCMGASRGNPGEALRLAQKHYPDDPGVHALVEKTGVAGASAAGSHWVDDMVPYNVMADFIEFLRPGSIVGKFGGPNPGGGPNYPSLARVGFNERVSGASSGLTAGWRGEGLPAIPSAMVTFSNALTWANVTALAVLTKEAIRFSNPNAEARVRDDIARAVNAKIDLDFVDPAKAASAGVSPASITWGVAATAPTGVTAAYFRTDLASMLKQFTTNNLGVAGVVLIMSNTMALELSMMINTLGNPDFPDVNPEGGSIRRIPVITSEHLTAVGSPSTQTIVAVKAPEVYLADDGVVTVEASDQASIEMQDSSSQSGITGTGASLVSLWQNGLVGLLATREITWKLRRSTAVQYISPAAYAA